MSFEEAQYNKESSFKNIEESSLDNTKEEKEREGHEYLISKKGEISNFLKNYSENQISDRKFEFLTICDGVVKNLNNDLFQRQDYFDAHQVYEAIKNINIGEYPGVNNYDAYKEYIKKEEQESKEGGKLFEAREDLNKKIEEIASKHLWESGNKIIRIIASEIITGEVLAKAESLKGDLKLSFIDYYSDKMMEVADKIYNKFFKQKDEETGPYAEKKEVLSSFIYLENPDFPSLIYENNTLIQWNKDLDDNKRIKFGGPKKYDRTISNEVMKKIINLFAEEIDNLK